MTSAGLFPGMSHPRCNLSSVWWATVVFQCLSLATLALDVTDQPSTEDEFLLS